MQIIQSIRDKGAAIVITVIALSLIGFILMDAQQGGARLFGALSSNAGEVDGSAIEMNEFNKKLQEAEVAEEQRSGQKPSGARLYQLRDQVWDQIVAQRIFNKEVDKIGLNTFTSKELSSVLLSNDPTNPLMQEQSLLDPATGKLDLAKAQEAINNIKKMKGEQLSLVNTQLVEPVTINTKVNKYTALINSSVYVPAWMKDQEKNNNSRFSMISYVNIPFVEIADSLVKVTDADINDYVKKNKHLFKQEAGRTISYYAFTQTPTAEDSSMIKQTLAELRQQFEADTNAVSFVARSGSVIEFKDNYIPKAQIPSIEIDNIIAQPVGTVVGPYPDRGNYVIAKYLGSKPIPDSVKARHILIVTTDRNTGQQVRDEASAEKLADSLLSAVNGGSDFGMLASIFSADGSKEKGGDLGTFGFGAMVPEFNDFCFYKSTGERGVVKTQFGYHVIEINQQMNFNPAHKIAFVAKEIFASDVTINNASLAATKASAQTDAKALSDYAAKNGLKVVSVPGIVKKNDYNVNGMDDARQLVRWVFEAKKGDVSEPFSLGDQFIVATLDKIMEEGLQDAATARPVAEFNIRNNKKAEIIIKKTGANPTLEAAAAAYNKPVMEAGADSSIIFSSQVISGIGLEPKVIGAAFCKEFQSKPSPAIKGSTGVFVVKVNSIGSKGEASEETAKQQISNRTNSMKSQIANWYESLRKAADIEDNRNEFY